MWQGNGDAYRHAYWSALMTNHISRDFAYQAGYPHEGYSHGDSLSSLDVKMDIENNYRGRIDGTTWSSSSNASLGTKIADTISAGSPKVRIRTHTTGTPAEYIDGVPTKYTGKFVPTSDGGRVK
ncbi:DUF6973 domain-containing protein [Peribacillus sp. SCS-37]|uniref:DUF6973 domain-containing protein n=1 Tax=Paraperibacillus esterisolvens TaxID=3115296 RepID=UPI003906C5FD